MHPITSTVTLAAAVANGYAQAQVVAAGGVPLTLNGSLVVAGVGTPDAPRRVIIASGGNDSAITFTITGTNRPEMQGSALVETLTGTNGGTAVSTQDFATVTKIVSSAAAAGNVTVGTNGTGSGPWVPWDTYQTDFLVTCVGYVLAGSPTWGVEYTYDDVFGLWLPSGVPFPRAVPLASLTAQTGTGFDAKMDSPRRASRLTLTAVGSAQLVQQQQGT